MAEVQELRRGSVFVEEEQLWRVVDHQHIKMGRGSATVRLKVRNVRSGSTVEKTYTNGSRVQDVELDKDEVQFQYNDGDHYYFMNTETFETIPISKDLLDDVLNYLTDNTLVTLESFEGEPISVSMLVRMSPSASPPVWRPKLSKSNLVIDCKPPCLSWLAM